MKERPNAESEKYEIYVKFYRGDLSQQAYEAFKESVRDRIRNVLPISQGSASARAKILQMKITKNNKE